jgi:hypothetical protein
MGIIPTGDLGYAGEGGAREEVAGGEGGEGGRSRSSVEELTRPARIKVIAGIFNKSPSTSSSREPATFARMSSGVRGRGPEA